MNFIRGQNRTIMSLVDIVCKNYYYFIFFGCQTCAVPVHHLKTSFVTNPDKIMPDKPKALKCDSVYNIHMLF